MKLQKWIATPALAAAVITGQVALDKAMPELGLTQAAWAQNDQAKKPERETRKTPALRNKVYEKLSEAQVFAEGKQYAEAEEILQDMISDDGKNALNSYELANVYNLYAFLAYSREDFAGALNYYNQVIAQPNIPLAMEINTKFTVAQLYFVQEQWQNGIDALQEWFSLTDKPNANSYVLLAQGYYQLKQYDLALKNVETAINMYETDGKLPKEQWYGLAQFLYFDKGDNEKALETVKTLLTYFPKKQYWMQATQLYGELKDEPRQLAMLEAAYEQGLLDKSQDIVLLASLYLNSEVPFPAARAMEKGLESEVVEDISRNYELTGAAWRQAQERGKAIPMMEKAAESSEEGELYARLGNVYLDGDEFRKAVDAIQKGLSRGGVKRRDQAQLVLGMAHFNLGDYDAARKAFRDAAKDERSEKYARQWLTYVSSEEERLAQLESD